MLGLETLDLRSARLANHTKAEKHVVATISTAAIVSRFVYWCHWNFKVMIYPPLGCRSIGSLLK